MGIFDRIHTLSFPHTHPQVFLAFQLVLNSSELNNPFKLLIKMVNTDGDVQIQVSGDVKLEGKLPAGDQLRVPQIAVFNGVAFASAGRYSFDIFIDGHRGGGVSVDLAAGPAQQAAKAVP